MCTVGFFLSCAVDTDTVLMEKNGFADELFGECGHFGQIKGEDGEKGNVEETGWSSEGGRVDWAIGRNHQQKKKRKKKKR